MGDYKQHNPLIVQGDHTILLEVDNPLYADARDALAVFAELVKSPEHIHTYRISPLSVWNACALGRSTGDIITSLVQYSKYPIPEHVVVRIQDYVSRFGRLRLTRHNDSLFLTADDAVLAREISQQPRMQKLFCEQIGSCSFALGPEDRGKVKQELIKLGFPVEDLAGYTEGEPLALTLRPRTAASEPFALRPYQERAASAFHMNGSVYGGSGVVVLPCGAGKTVVGMACMKQFQVSTLILVTNVTAARQWIDELLDKTSLTREQIGEYSGRKKQIRPVTVSTYQIMTYRKSRQDPFIHLDLFRGRNWGLIIYDEVHLLPAPVFQATSGLQARRRLGLTATLVREDGCEKDVFALIGPKKADVPWKELEAQGWIAQASCTEVRVLMPKELQVSYSVASSRRKFRIASENPRKLDVLSELLQNHRENQVLVMGMYIDQVKEIAERFDIPLVIGSTSHKRRKELFAAFRSGAIKTIAVSKVANFSVDLPDASVAIQVSGTFGSRQEEAQRLGRILRPKNGSNQAFFYSLVSHDTVEQEFSLKRQLFLCEQGYEYRISFVEK